jgi:coenzyme F420-0:L-glutamate ligase/coenzyme F420-1:gamma-L-glutamate ligase
VTLTAIPLLGIPEVRPGHDLAGLLIAAATAPDGPGLYDGDVLVVTSKVVSKAEGRIVRGRDRDEVIDAETQRVVSSWEGPNGRTVIAETRHGLVLAAAGVDASNTEPGTLVLLPLDPDASAAGLRTGVRERTGANVAVVISDTLGRPWRKGQTDAAIGAAGLQVMDDLRGRRDSAGNTLDVTIRAVADEIASTAELVAGKASGIPAVVLRGLSDLVLPPGSSGTGAVALIRPAEEDRFRLGTPEAMRAAVKARRTVREFTDEPVARETVDRAIEAAATAPAPHHTEPWRFVLLQTPAARHRVLGAMREAWIADLRGDGFDDDTIVSRVRHGNLLGQAPCLILVCLVTEGMHAYPDARRQEAEHSMFLLSAGAAIQNLLVALAADGIGSAWMSSALFCPDVTREALGLQDTWEPVGIVAAGVAGRRPDARNRLLEKFVVLV